MGHLRHDPWRRFWPYPEQVPAFRRLLRNLQFVRGDESAVVAFLCAVESFPTPLRGNYMGFVAARLPSGCGDQNPGIHSGPGIIL